MRKKPLPKAVRAWLILLGFYAGTIGTLIMTCVAVIDANAGFYAFLAMLVVSVVVGFVLSERKRETLVEYGLLEPKKKKRGKKE